LHRILRLGRFTQQEIARPPTPGLRVARRWNAIALPVSAAAFSQSRPTVERDVSHRPDHGLIPVKERNSHADPLKALIGGQAMIGNGDSRVRATRRASTRKGGYTLIEVMTVVGIIGVVIGMAVPSVIEWRAYYRAKRAARNVADIFHHARAEALRTGQQQVVFFGNPGLTDPGGNAVQAAGTWVPVLAVDDGAAATANCRIDPGEVSDYIRPEGEVSWGVSHATGPVASDSGGAAFNPDSSWDGATFTKPDASKANWVMFRSDGIPVAFEGDGAGCGTVGDTGTGGGGLYVTDGQNDFAIVLTPLGGVRLHLWDGGAWSG
jgi:prepilin-type N-terminal cleavage/methylation domain-containing protein